MEVSLLSYPNVDPVKICATAAHMCTNSDEKHKLPKDFTLVEADKLVRRVLKMGHESIAEHVNLTFKISGISRACSHQLVRYRVASYCLSGDTVIYRFNNNRKHLTIKELYDRSLDSFQRSRNDLMTLRSVTDKNIIVPNKMLSVIKSGVKDVYEITTKLGYSIKSSKEHKFFNKSGEVRMKDIRIGEYVYVNGLELYKDKTWFEDKYNNGMNTREIAELCGVSPITARKWKRVHGIASKNEYKSHDAWNKGITGEDSHAYGRVATEETKVKLSESALNRDKDDAINLTPTGVRSRFTKLKKEKCKMCGEVSCLENHHIDRNIYNDSEENCMTLCTSCHKLVHKGAVVKKVVLDEVVTIEYKGEEETYDIEMENPYHNFIANGFVVHNSQQSQRYVHNEEPDYVVPSRIKELGQEDRFKQAMENAWAMYRALEIAGVHQEDARYVLPNATTTNITVTMNARELRHIARQRLCNRAQWEIRDLVRLMVDLVNEVAPVLLEDIGPACFNGDCPEGKLSCGKPWK